MNQIWIFIIGVVLGAFVVWLVFRNKNQTTPEFMQKQADEKEKNKQKILELFNGKDKITNDDVQKSLGVSDKTAQRYFNELQAEGKIKQTGETGLGVYYTKS